MLSLIFLLWLLPLLAALLLFLVPGIPHAALKRCAIVLSLLPLALLAINHRHFMGSDLNVLWLPGLDVRFHLRVDALSLVFLYLTAVIIPISLLPVDSRALTSPNLFYACVLLLQALLIVFFTAADLVVFTLFWEAMLLPLFLMISRWGGPHRQTAAMQFLIYMIAGSALMVLAVLTLYLVAGTFEIDALASHVTEQPLAVWIGAIFLLAFAVKTPLFPFHGWLPSAYTQASVTGTILLAALLSKAGVYGILRLGVGLFPTLLQQWSPCLIGLAITGVLYGGLAAWSQRDYKRLIAYSSFSHVNFILVGLFVWDQAAHIGAILQTINHAVTITALFIVAHWLEQRVSTTAMGPVSGAATWLPHLCWLTLFFVLASVALPGTSNFVGELLIFFGLFGYSPWLTACLGLTMILSVIYMLRWMRKTYFSEPVHQGSPHVDISLREWLVAAPLIVLILAIGLYPKPLLKHLDKIQPSLVWEQTS
jgi:NADH-quinone oxidoreductase subunit M